jgi:hypothetical protein
LTKSSAKLKLNVGKKDKNMKKKFVLPLLLTAGVLLFALAILPMAASAIAREGESTERTDSDQPQLLMTQEERKQRLEGEKLRRCQLRDKKITSIMQRGVSRAENHAKVFDKIADRVKAFYENKGKTVANYDELVAAVDGAKATFETDLNTLKGLDGFSCDSDDPKADAEAYKAAHDVVRQDLRQYRTAVKDLIVGVRSAQSQEGSE